MNDKELERLSEIGADWDVLGGASVNVTPKYRRAEALLHEVCHAVALELPIDRAAPDRISRRFDSFNRWSNKLGLTAECQVLAIETHAVKVLKWPVDMREMAIEVYNIGKSGQAFKLTTFLTIYEEFLRDKRIKTIYAPVAVGAIRRMARSRRRSHGH